MMEDPHIQHLLDELLESDATPEEVCVSWPELLPEVARRWQEIRGVRAELDAMFPTQRAADRPSFSADETPLPRIPGYEVETVLGRGGMGVVFRARHVRLNRVVALKMALADAYAGPQERSRFQREAEAVAQLQHPHVVQIHDVGDSEGRPYFTMEYVDGGSLAERIRNAPQSACQAAELLETLANAVHAAHRHGIVHRDLKPANVLMTSDGTPKIGDFGLARHLDGEASITPAGTALGTPSYMSPEQARGPSSTIGPAADIYALGAILYETLTGRPPFHAATAAETVLQVLSQEPVPPSRLNATVPRELETICLKCLHKQPQRRYPSAAALAEDLHRFQRGQPILGRRMSRPERLLRWIRRNPSTTALACSVVALVGLSAGAAMREWAATAERRHESEKASARLDYVLRLQQDGRFSEARLVLGRLSDGGQKILRNRIAQAQQDLNLAERFDTIRLGRATRLGHKLAIARSDDEYEKAFREAGLGGPEIDAEAVAARIRDSNIRTTLVAALDDWSACALDPQRQNWILATARKSDADPTSWRDRARDPKTWAKSASLAETIAAAPVAAESVPLLLALAERTRSVGVDPILFLKRVQKTHPDDFWANLSLAEALMEKNDLPETLRFYQAALALRPETAVVYDNIGLALGLLGRMDEADEQFREASRIDPAAVLAHDHLGIAFAAVGRRNEEIDPAKLPRYFRPDVARLHGMLGDHLREKGKLAEAMDRYRQAIALDPKLATAQVGLRNILLRQGRFEDARVAWAAALDAGLPDYPDCDGYAELCLFLGKESEYGHIRTAILERFGATTDLQTAERAGRACLLRSADAKEFKAAEKLVDRALAGKGAISPSALPYYRFAKGLADYRRGRVIEAISTMDGDASRVMGPSPRLIKAMAQHRLGHVSDARKTLAAAVESFDWQPSLADSRDVWIHHVLRREAESLLLPNLRAYLAGNFVPGNNNERLALLEECSWTKYPHVAARLYVDLFAADPGLADDLQSGRRYRAARAAALVGGERGEDGAGLAGAEKEQWRKRARQWLRADLAAWDRTLSGATDKQRERVRSTLGDWRREPDLADLREPAALAKLSADERKDCSALWDEVATVLEHTHGRR
jgi:eukaryotic-like serine/threonine-protein kinase